MARASRLVQFPSDRRRINEPGLSPARNATMLSVIGNPRGSYTQDCQPVTNHRIAALMATRSVGPFRVTGLKPAVDAVEAVMRDIRASEPSLFTVLGTAGMLCCRLVRGSASAISNHAWGTAIDLKLDGVIDRRGDNLVQEGLLALRPHFNRHGFFWGAAFPTEDAMHFEASEELIRSWATDGLLGERAPAPADRIAVFGDRTARVEEIQARLNAVLGIGLEPDGIFGRDTRAAVVEFQGSVGLSPTGEVDLATFDVLVRLSPNVESEVVDQQRAAA